MLNAFLVKEPGAIRARNPGTEIDRRALLIALGVIVLATAFAIVVLIL